MVSAPAEQLLAVVKQAPSWAEQERAERLRRALEGMTLADLRWLVREAQLLRIRREGHVPVDDVGRR